MKSYFEERSETYTEINGLLIPNFVMDPQPEGEIDIWGWRRKWHLKEYKKGVYNTVLMNGTLTLHLTDTNEAALDLIDSLVKQTATSEGMTEEIEAARVAPLSLPSTHEG